MPTLFTHPAVALIRPWFPRVSRRALWFGVVATMLPDADVLTFGFGIPYGSTFGHRGFTHSIVFALLVAALGTWKASSETSRNTTFVFLLLCAMSHPLLDAMTNGGRGVAFFSPFSNHRYFFPWRPIAVSPIGVDFFDREGLAVLVNEARLVWLPCVMAGLLGWIVARARRS